MKKVILVNDTSSENHHGCTIVIQQYKFFFKKNNLNLIYSHDTNRDFISFKKEVLNTNLKFDILIINGEGSLYNSNKKTKEIIKIGYWVKTILKKKVILMNAIFQNNNKEIINYIRQYDQIYLRDELSSAELVRSNIINKVVPDLVFSFKSKLKSKHNYQILFTDSVFSSVSHQLLLLSKKINNAIFTPLVSSPNISSPLKYMRFWIRFNILKIPFIFKKYKNLDYEIQKEYKSFNTFMALCSNSELIICGRYHAIIISLILKKPFIAIKSNTHKVESLLREIGLEDRLVEFNDLNSNIYAKFSSYSKSEILLINSFIKKSNSKIKEMFDEIST